MEATDTITANRATRGPGGPGGAGGSASAGEGGAPNGHPGETITRAAGAGGFLGLGLGGGLDRFARVFIEMGVLTWPNGFDMDALNLHMKMSAAGELHRDAAE